jgi:hypothetical protein
MAGEGGRAGDRVGQRNKVPSGFAALGTARGNASAGLCRMARSMGWPVRWGKMARSLANFLRAHGGGRVVLVSVRHECRLHRGVPARCGGAERSKGIGRGLRAGLVGTTSSARRPLEHGF